MSEQENKSPKQVDVETILEALEADLRIGLWELLPRPTRVT